MEPKGKGKEQASKNFFTLASRARAGISQLSHTGSRSRHPMETRAMAETAAATTSTRISDTPLPDPETVAAATASTRISDTPLTLPKTIAAATTSTRISDTRPSMELVWYIPLDSNNTLLGKPTAARLGYRETIFELMEAIRGGPYKDDLAHEDLEAWRFPSLSLCNVRPDQISHLVEHLTFSSDEDSDGEIVSEWIQVKTLQLQQLEPLVVRIIQKVKRKRTDDPANYFERAKLTKLAGLEPSKVNDPSIYNGLQLSQQERILDDCPLPDTDIPPLPLLYSGFGRFHDMFKHPTAVSLETDLMDEVDQLVNTACGLGYEKEKKVLLQERLRRIFTLGTLREFSHAVGNGSTTDGHLLANHGGPLMIIEYKRQIDAAEAQLSSYFLRLALKPAEDVFRGWRQPALGLLIRGMYISFHGLVMVDQQVRILPLTPVFPCNDSELHNRLTIYAAFGAARHLLTLIEQDATNFVTSPPPPILGSRRRYPNVASLLRVSSNDSQSGDRLSFEITDRFTTGLEGDRLMYLASTHNHPDPPVILVKFSRKYSVELHQFCASIGHAPQLLAFERLPGGWFGVAMEYFPSATRILLSENLSSHGEKWLDDIDRIITAFHTKGLVHGDLRPPNFIINEERLMLVDFDWGGKEDEATFPDGQLHSILRENRHETLITKERDNMVIQYTKGAIREKRNRKKV